MIKQTYDDNKKHVHVLSYGGGTQSTALLLMALKGEINGVIPDHIIFSDTGWEPQYVYDWVEKVNAHIKEKYNKEIIFTNGGNIREDLLKSAETGSRIASLPFFTKDKHGKIGMVLRQCTNEYKIEPVNKKVRELLGYKPRQWVREMVHVWKGISTDEIQRVKPIMTMKNGEKVPSRWLFAEHPLVDNANMDRNDCIKYVENEGLGTPAKSSCIGCPFHDNAAWIEMKKNDPKSFEDAVLIDKKIRNLPKLKNQAYLHRSGRPLGEIEFKEQMDLDMFIDECEGFCGT